MSARLTKAKMVETCDGCGYGPVMAEPCTAPHRQNYEPDSVHVWLCSICRATWCGNAAIYGRDDSANVLATIVHCTHLVLVEVRKASGGTR